MCAIGEIILAESESGSSSDDSDSEKEKHKSKKRKREKKHKDKKYISRACMCNMLLRVLTLALLMVREKHKKHKKEKKHKREKDDGKKERRLLKEAKALLEKEAAVDKDTKIEPITDADYFLKNPELCVWLKENKNIYFNDLSSEESREYFKQFVEEWNSKKLPKKFYDGIDAAAVSSSRTKHSWAAKKVASTPAMKQPSHRDRDESHAEREARMADEREATRKQERLDRKAWYAIASLRLTTSILRRLALQPT